MIQFFIAMGIVLVLYFIGSFIVGLFSGSSSDSSNYDSSYDYDYSSSSDNDDHQERFETRYPYTYDKETGFSQCDYTNHGNWVDAVGNEYEQKTDCWGSVYYEKIEDDDDDD